MSPYLKLNDFVLQKDLWCQEHMPDNVFDLLGAPLESWLTRFLAGFGVKSNPVVHGKVASTAHIEGPVYIHADAIVEPSAYIQGPAYIGPKTEIRHAAYIRGNVYVGRGCVVGHTTEVKGSCFFDEAKAGHFAYVGDSLLGRNVNLGAGTKCANLKLKRNEVFFMHPESNLRIGSGLRKFGAIISDDVQTGCNSVLSPGTILGRATLVLPCVHYQGTLLHGIARGAAHT